MYVQNAVRWKINFAATVRHSNEGWVIEVAKTPSSEESTHELFHLAQSRVCCEECKNLPSSNVDTK